MPSRLAAALALALVAAPARGQSTDPADSLPVRAGTWALEGGVSTGGTTTPSLGVLRFAGGRTAIGLNAFGGHSSTSGSEVFGSSDQSSNFAGASLGLRRYTRVRSALAGFGTVGVVGSYVRTAYNTGAFGESSSRQTSAGGFGELGAAYLVARRLGVNLFTRAELTRRFGRSSSLVGTSDSPVPTQVTERTRGWNVQAGGVGVSATLFF